MPCVNFIPDDETDVDYADEKCELISDCKFIILL